MSKKVVSFKTKKKRDAEQMETIRDEIRMAQEELFCNTVEYLASEIIAMVIDDVSERDSCGERETRVEFHEDLFKDYCEDDDYYILFHPLRRSDHAKSTKILQDRCIDLLRSIDLFKIASYDETTGTAILEWNEITAE